MNNKSDMINLTDKLQTINSPKVPILSAGTCNTLAEIWNKRISPLMPAKEIVLKWHSVLMEYVEKPDAMFAIRGFNSARNSNDYHVLRRGFLTRTNNDYSFFYTDNFHAAYYLKLAMDGIVPSVDELLRTYNKRQFPSRFGPDTSSERELSAIPGGKDPGIQSAGFKLAHIFNVGKDYFFDGRILSLTKDILQAYFPRGERGDWHMVSDATGQYHVRDLKVPQYARSFLVAEFLRFVHPFNYFLVPKSSLSSVDVSENQDLISFVRSKLKELYGAAYEEFLSRIMVSPSLPPTPLPNHRLEISYSFLKQVSMDTGSSSSKCDSFRCESPHPSIAEGADESCEKALQRIERVMSSDSIIHETIQRALDLGCTDTDVVYVRQLLVGRTNPGTIASMKTEAGKSYGRYFVSEGRGTVRFVSAVWRKLKSLGWSKTI